MPASRATSRDDSKISANDQGSLDSSSQPKIKFPNGYMAGGVWVSGDLGSTNAAIPLPVLTWWDFVPMNGVVVSFDTSTNSGGAARASGWCAGNATYDQIMSILTESADLVLGAPNLQDTKAVCNAMSIGIGFSVTPIQPATSAVPAKTPPATCTP